MPPKIPGLGWLNSRDQAQILWAVEYLRGRGIRDVFAISKPTYADLLAAGMKLDGSTSGQMILIAMRNAWRQKRYRDPQNGRRARTFSLQNESIKALSRLARKNGLTETDQLQALIDQADELQRAVQQDIQRQAVSSKAVRKNDKHASARYQIQLDLLTEYLQRNLTALTRWEMSVSDTALPLDEAEVEKLAKTKIKQVRHDINEAILRFDIATPRDVMPTT